MKASAISLLITTASLVQAQRVQSILQRTTQAPVAHEQAVPVDTGIHTSYSYEHGRQDTTSGHSATGNGAWGPANGIFGAEYSPVGSVGTSPLSSSGMLRASLPSSSGMETLGTLNNALPMGYAAAPNVGSNILY
ncbi:hypothetical protein Ae201684P_018789 [Aphanomyces euteiches]|nr:hypothetical protein Ae201684P_018789 [Aphanomyces euteiches]